MQPLLQASAPSPECLGKNSPRNVPGWRERPLYHEKHRSETKDPGSPPGQAGPIHAPDTNFVTADISRIKQPLPQRCLFQKFPPVTPDVCVVLFPLQGARAWPWARSPGRTHRGGPRGSPPPPAARGRRTWRGRGRPAGPPPSCAGSAGRTAAATARPSAGTPGTRGPGTGSAAPPLPSWLPDGTPEVTAK